MSLADDITAERAQFCELLQGLSDAEMDKPSLCEGWSARDVAAHAISYDRINPLLFVPLFVLSGFSIDRTNRMLVRWWRRQPTSRIVDAFHRSPTPRGMMRLLGKRIALLDCLVHQQDIRRPLGRPRAIPPERLAAVAEILRHHRIGAGGIARARGLRFVATDTGWSAGEGPSVEGPAEAIVMVLAGRATALHDLRLGEGKDVIAQRLIG